MQLQIKGRNVEINDSIRSYAEKKLGKLERQLADGARVELELMTERNPSIAQNQVAEVTVFTKGPVLRARESSSDMKATIDQLVEKLERQVKRYSQRRRRKQVRAAAPEEMPALPAEGETLIVKTKQFTIKPMSAEEAVLQLELIGHDFFVFRDAETSEVNVLYRRRDGNYGLIDPQ